MSRCTAVECCIDFHDPLQQTLHFFLDLDFCMQTFRVGIENLLDERTLFSYQYGIPTSLFCLYKHKRIIFVEDLNLFELYEQVSSTL